MDPAVPMPYSQHRQKLLVILGPTGAGKTQLSLDLAKRVGGEIISADSRYLYKGLDIGTAKPTLAERAQVPHHLIDVTTPDQPWSLAQYQIAAVGLIGEINGRGRLPMLVGGTGQYVQAILEGWTIPAGETDDDLRAHLQAQADAGEGVALVQRLQMLDPVAAEAIDPRNLRRVIRALEVTLRTGQPFSQQRKKNPPNYQTYVIGLNLPREALYKRLDTRIEAMLANGLVAEVQGLAAQGFGWELPAMSAIGYKQVGAYLQGRVSLDEAVAQIKHDTRVFVRRQANWFKPDDPAIHWLNGEHINLDELAGEVRTFFD